MIRDTCGPAGWRVVAAREFLRHVHTGPGPAALPRQVADREAAELRRLLGQVLDYVDSRPAALDLTDAYLALGRGIGIGVRR